MVLSVRNAPAQQPGPLQSPDARTTQSAWVYPGTDGRLVYRTTPRGDRIIDFSHAGYMGGGVALPSLSVAKTVSPAGGRKDDTRQIQNAIDEVSALPLRNGFRGAVLLAPGEFVCSRTLYIRASGVVLRGSGSGPGGTTIRMVGEKHCAIIIGEGKGNQEPQRAGPGPAVRPGGGATVERESVQTTIADPYVPSGSLAFVVADSRGFAVGDAVIIKRPTTATWLHAMRMDNLKRDGHSQTFIRVGRTGDTQRRITAIDGKRVTVDVPLSDSYDARYLDPPGTLVCKDNLSSSVTQAGIEQLHIQCPPLEIKYSSAPYSALRIGGDDCWVKDVYCEETMNSTAVTGRRVTLQQVVVTHTYPNLGASKPADFSIQGCQVLIDRCKASGGNTYFVWTGSLQAGPNVVLNSSFSGYGSRLQPHQRWATGLLFDNCRIPDGGIDFMNRGVAGSGHGWTMGWGVAWNCAAKTYIIQNPPESHNWAIGCVGARRHTARLFDSVPILPEGEFDSFGRHVAPQSLYLAQLEERLGARALRNIGYAANSIEQLADSTLSALPELQYDVDAELGRDVAMYRPVNASNVRGTTRMYGAEKALDGNPGTYWAVDDSVKTATFEVDMEGPVEINAVEICEANGFEGRVLAYRVEGQVDSDWKLLSQGATVGGRRRDRFPGETVWKVRLTIVKLRSYPAIRKFGLYMKEEYFIEDSSRVVVEIDSVAGVNGWATGEAAESGQARTYLYWTGAQFLATPGKHMLEYKVKINHPGTYRFIWNSKVGMGDSKTEHNDTWLRVPDASDFYAERSGHIVRPRGVCTDDCPNGAGSDGWFKVYSSGTTDWTWSTRTSDNDGHDIYVTCADSGIYTVQISPRSSGHLLDRFVLFKESVYTQDDVTSFPHPESTSHPWKTE